MGLIVGILAVAIAFNAIILLIKFRIKRYADALLDLGILITISFLFVGSITGLAAGTFGSMLVSLYLLISPVRILKPLHKVKRS